MIMKKVSGHMPAFEYFLDVFFFVIITIIVVL